MHKLLSHVPKKQQINKYRNTKIISGNILDFSYNKLIH